MLRVLSLEMLLQKLPQPKATESEKQQRAATVVPTTSALLVTPCQEKL